MIKKDAHVYDVLNQMKTTIPNYYKNLGKKISDP